MYSNKILFCVFISIFKLYNGNTQIDVDTKQRIEQIDRYLLDLTKEKKYSGGLLIIKDGTTLIKKGYGYADRENHIPFSSNTLASIGSITKAFTAAAILKLVEQRKLNLEDPLIKFFPDIPHDKSNITIHQLLTHSGGFHEFLKKDGGDYEKIVKNEFLLRAFSEPLSFDPGKKAIYTNVGMSILAIIIEQVSNLDYEQYLKINLFDKNGIKSIGYRYPIQKMDSIAIGYQNGVRWGTHQTHFDQAGGGPYWNLKGNGGLEASLNDMEKWINGITSERILTKASVDKMFTAQVKEDNLEGEYYFGYGCNISKSQRNTKMIGNGGSNGIYYARIIRLPEEGLVFYMVTNESSINTNMVLPNVTQLFFNGKIDQDAIAIKPKFESEQSKKIYDMLKVNDQIDLGVELNKAGIQVDDDMVLLGVGQALMEERKFKSAYVLYHYYTHAFPNIVVAWNDFGDVLLNLSNKEEAIRCYRNALKVRPGNPRAAEALKKLGQ